VVSRERKNESGIAKREREEKREVGAAWKGIRG